MRHPSFFLNPQDSDGCQRGWREGVYQAMIPKTRFSVDPDDGELAAFGLRLHTKHITPPPRPHQQDSRPALPTFSDPSPPESLAPTKKPSTKIVSTASNWISSRRQKRRTSTRNGTRRVVASFSTPPPTTPTKQPNSSREQLDFIKEAKKKNKYETWHETSCRLILNAASDDADEAAEFILPSYLRIINSETAGMADREL